MDITSLHGDLDRSSEQPLHIQLYRRLRGAVLDGRLPPGTRLPASRALQEQLGVARNTVLNALYTAFRRGLHRRVAGHGNVCVPGPAGRLDVAGAAAVHGVSESAPTERRLLSRRSQLLAQSPTMPSVEWHKPRPFYRGVPAYDRFPMRIWRRLCPTPVQGGRSSVFWAYARGSSAGITAKTGECGKGWVSRTSA
ncbi:GntR family transcriptional regulator [Streptomyces sp. NBC_01288]|uniref:GntR family transcriptional regulator n=1 Tax=Streptomyces sp. NBC_01288 TaxID=2903814 RepID=UPI002E148631